MHWGLVGSVETEGPAEVKGHQGTLGTLVGV